MDIGDIIRLLFFAFIFLSFFGGLFGRRSGDEEEQQPQRRLPRPTDIFESGGESPRPRPVAMQRPAPAMHEQEWEEETFAAPEQHKEEVRQRYQRQNTWTYDDAVETDRAAGLESRLEEAQRRYGTRSDRGAIAASERALLEQDVTMDTDPERRSRRSSSGQLMRRRRRRTGGDVLHRSLTNPDTLERAFIVKEVLDKPLGMRPER